MTGTIDALTDTTVTVGGVRYEYPRGLRDVLELFREAGCTVSLFVVGGRVTYVSRVPS